MRVRPPGPLGEPRVAGLRDRSDARPAGLGGHACRRLGQVDADEVGALAREREDESASDAARRSGDDDGRPAKPHRDTSAPRR